MFMVPRMTSVPLESTNMQMKSYNQSVVIYPAPSGRVDCPFLHFSVEMIPEGHPLPGSVSPIEEPIPVKRNPERLAFSDDTSITVWHENGHVTRSYMSVMVKVWYANPESGDVKCPYTLHWSSHQVDMPELVGMWRNCICCRKDKSESADEWDS